MKNFLTSSVIISLVFILPILAFAQEKCVTENGVKICDLSYDVQATQLDGTRNVSFQANAIYCINTATGKQTQNQGNSIVVDAGNMYCASDIGAVYIDPTIRVAKYFNKIVRDSDSSPYYIPVSYEACIWTYADGNGDIPYIEFSNQVGPSTGYSVEAFCKNGDNQVDIYSYKDNSSSNNTLGTANSTNQNDTSSNPVVPTDSNSNSSNGWTSGIGLVVGIFIVRWIIAFFRKNKTNTENNKEKTYSSYKQSYSYTEPPKKEDIKKLYMKLVKKYHPDFAQSDADKKFRSELTAKLNNAYKDGDIDTLRMFE